MNATVNLQVTVLPPVYTFMTFMLSEMRATPNIVFLLF